LIFVRHGIKQSVMVESCALNHVSKHGEVGVVGGGKGCEGGILGREGGVACPRFFVLSL
jgi:hypothetical protein